jgi:hypothetical protein
MAKNGKRVWGRAAPRPTIDELLASRERLNRTTIEFLKVDLETGLTFATIARQASNDHGMQRNRRAARKSYNTVIKMMPKTDLSSQDQAWIEQGLSRLKTELERLGEIF